MRFERRESVSIVTASALGLSAVLLAVWLKSVKSEYGVYLILAAGLLLFFYGAGKMKIILETAEKIQSYIGIDRIYLVTLLKLAGITYIAEFASGICKDAGYGAMGNQIEIFAKLSILAVSMPMVLALLETLKEFLS